jgi:hypothetical protein
MLLLMNKLIPNPVAIIDNKKHTLGFVCACILGKHGKHDE